MNPQPWLASVPHWLLDGSAAVSEAQLLEEQMLRAGILASLQDAPEEPGTKVEVPKSSVSFLRSVRFTRAFTSIEEHICGSLYTECTKH